MPRRTTPQPVTPAVPPVMPIHRVSYTVDEVAESTGLSVSNIWKQIADKALIATRIGRRTLVMTEDLDAFLRARRSA